MPTEVPTSQENPKFKITTKVVWNESEDESGSGRKGNGQKVKASGTGNKPAKSLKRKPEVSLDGQGGKETKRSRTLKIHCQNILKKLLCHQYSFIFKEPVDPVKYNIPNYFSVISKPMDLGTIKRKLDGNMYFSADDFAADVKLTFSNATRFNPETHVVHKMAKVMNDDFCRRWKSLEAKLKQMKEIDDRGSFVHPMESNSPVAKEGVGNRVPDPKPIGLDKESINEGVGNSMPGSKQIGLDKEIIDSSPGDKKLWKLRTEVSSMDATCEKGITISFSMNTGFKTFEFCCEGIL